MDHGGWGGTLGNLNYKYVEFDFSGDPLASRHLYMLLWIWGEHEELEHILVQTIIANNCSPDESRVRLNPDDN